MKRKYVNELNKIYNLLISDDVDCKLLGLRLLELHPVWANLNKHFTHGAVINYSFGLSNIRRYSSDKATINKKYIEETIKALEDPHILLGTVNYRITVLLNYIYSLKNSWNSKHNRFTFNGENPFDPKYKGKGIAPKLHIANHKKQKIKNNESKHRQTRLKTTVTNISRKDYIKLNKLFKKKYIISRYGIRGGKYSLISLDDIF